jgi:hypothetical protein
LKVNKGSQKPGALRRVFVVGIFQPVELLAFGAVGYGHSHGASRKADLPAALFTDYFRRSFMIQAGPLKAGSPMGVTLSVSIQICREAAVSLGAMGPGPGTLSVSMQNDLDF